MAYKKYNSKRKHFSKKKNSRRYGKSVMSHNFAQIPKANIERSKFNRSHGYKTTFDAGYLIPFFVDEILPGDTFNVKATALVRMATPIFPIMDNMRLDTQFFFVPNRLVWENWQKFNGEQEDPGDSTDYALPHFDFGIIGANTLPDYFGIPVNGIKLETNLLPFRAYDLIYNEWYRDQNLQDSVPLNKTDSSLHPSNFQLRKRGKRHDYFTSCLPWPQKGEAVTLPITSLEGDYNVEADNVAEGNLLSVENHAGDIHILHTYGTDSTIFPAARTGVYLGPDASDLDGSLYDSRPLHVHLDASTAATINELREAFQIQRLLERDARGGTRYIEIIKSHFGVVSPDARLQRPEYLGGGSQRINITPVEQTSSTDNTSPQGNLSAIGTSIIDGNGFTKSFTEHGYVIGLVSVRADLTYQQGLQRFWSRQTRYDFYWPALSHLGEQAVLNKEIYAGYGSQDNEVFGYQERYAEYRYFPSLITGKMRSDALGSLDAWHLSQNFSSLPELGSDFIEENPPIGRVVAVPSEPHFIMDCYFDQYCTRPMPVYSVPGMMDHF